MSFLACPVDTIARGWTGRSGPARRSLGWRHSRAASLLRVRAQRALRRRRRQKLPDHRKAQLRPSLMHPRSVSLRHACPPKMRGTVSALAERPATRILCGSLASVRKRASPMAPPVSGPRNRSKAMSCSLGVAGEAIEQRDRQAAMSIGGTTAAIATGAKGLSVKLDRHQARQRASVRRSTPSTTDRRARRARRRPVLHAPRSTSPPWRDRRGGRESAATAGLPACGSQSTAQQKLKRSVVLMASPAGPPRGLRSYEPNAARRRRPAPAARAVGREVAVEDEQLLMEPGVGQHGLVHGSVLYERWRDGQNRTE